MLPKPKYPWKATFIFACLVAGTLVAMAASVANVTRTTTSAAPTFVADATCVGATCEQALLVSDALAAQQVADNPDGVSGDNVPVWVTGVDDGNVAFTLTAVEVTSNERTPASWALFVLACAFSGAIGWYGFPQLRDARAAWRYDKRQWDRAYAAAGR
jgi:hypothetical protein